MNLYTHAVGRETIRFRNTLDRLHRLMPDILETEKLTDALVQAGLDAKAMFLEDGALAIRVAMPIDQLKEQAFLAKCVCLARRRQVIEEQDALLILPAENNSNGLSIRLLIEAI